MSGKKLSRKGDKNTTGGKIMRGASTVFANNKPVGLHKSEITPHDPRSQSPHKRLQRQREVFLCCLS